MQCVNWYATFVHRWWRGFSTSASTHLWINLWAWSFPRCWRRSSAISYRNLKTGVSSLFCSIRNDCLRSEQCLNATLFLPALVQPAHFQSLLLDSQKEVKFRIKDIVVCTWSRLNVTWEMRTFLTIFSLFLLVHCWTVYKGISKKGNVPFLRFANQFWTFLRLTQWLDIQKCMSMIHIHHVCFCSCLNLPWCSL